MPQRYPAAFTSPSGFRHYLLCFMLLPFSFLSRTVRLTFPGFGQMGKHCVAALTFSGNLRRSFSVPHKDEKRKIFLFFLFVIAALTKVPWPPWSYRACLLDASFCHLDNKVKRESRSKPGVDIGETLASRAVPSLQRGPGSLSRSRLLQDAPPPLPPVTGESPRGALLESAVLIARPPEPIPTVS